MKLTNSAVPVYTVSGSNINRDIPDWQPQKKRKNKDADYANRVELLQDFEFEEASQCVRVSEDGNWVMSTGTYKPQIHTHFLPNLSLSWARHTDTLNKTFMFLSSDYSKTVHLQEDRSVELHTPGGCHHSLRIPRYGRDLAYDRANTEILIPAIGVNPGGAAEVFRINLELGRFMNPFEIDTDSDSLASGGLQGGVRDGGVNTASIAEGSHGLFAFGTTNGSIEFWDPRSRARVATLATPSDFEGRPEVTALDFHHSGINLAAGTSSGLIYLYDLRSPNPTLKKDQGYGYPIHHLEHLHFSTATRAATTEPMVMSADKRIIKIWKESDGTPWSSVEPTVDINSVAWCRDSGMLLTANEGRSQHAFFIPQLGPAPRWCSFLDNIVEEMADDPNDPLAYNKRAGDVYDNHKFLTTPQLRALNLDHLIGKTNLLRPYMHGFFVAQQLYEEARLIANPTSWEDERARRVQEKIDKERESRIRGKKKVTARVNRKMVERIMEREEKNERRRAQRVLAQGGDEKSAPTETGTTVANEELTGTEPRQPKILADSRFSKLFQDTDFEIDETSHEFRQLNPSTKPAPRSNLDQERGLTAVEEELVDDIPNSSDSEASDGSDVFAARKKDGKTDERISSADYRRSKSKKDQQKDRRRRKQLEMRVSSSNNPNGSSIRNRDADDSFGARAKAMPQRERRGAAGNRGAVVGDRVITFEATKKSRKGSQRNEDSGRESGRRDKDRRSASGNTFRKM
jgi:ribosome biogenesis protein ENP2